MNYEIIKKVDDNMAKKLTEKTLMKKLNTMSQEELARIIFDLFKTNKSVEARLNLMILGDEYGSMLLEKYKKQLKKIFHSSNIVRTGLSMEQLRKIFCHC